MIAAIPGPLFELGRVVITPDALRIITESGQEPSEFLDRHVHGDWGILNAASQLQNDEAVAGGDRIFSNYRTDNGTKIWIITEPIDNHGHRPLTTILLPSEH